MNYYQKNKNKWKQYHQTQMDDPLKHKKLIERTAQWKKDNPEKTKIQKKKSTSWKIKRGLT